MFQRNIYQFNEKDSENHVREFHFYGMLILYHRYFWYKMG